MIVNYCVFALFYIACVPFAGTTILMIVNYCVFDLFYISRVPFAGTIYLLGWYLLYLDLQCDKQLLRVCEIYHSVPAICWTN